MARWRDIKQNRIPSRAKKQAPDKDEFLECASVLVRTKALLVDTFMITTPILYFVIYVAMGGGDGFSQDKIEGWSIIIIIHMVIFVSFWIKGRQAPGFKAYELKLIDNNTKGDISITKAIIRYLLTIISTVSIVGFLLPFFRKDKKTLQDLATNTCVISLN